jgi:hypothetical protein
MTKHLALAGLLTVVVASVSAAQSLPTVAFTNNEYVLTIPYLEYGSGAAKQAYAIVLRSSDLNTFVLDGSSVSLQPTLAAATDSPIVASSNGGYRLAVPRLRYGSQYYAAAFVSTDLSRFLLDGSTVAEVTPAGAVNGPTTVAVSNVSERTVGSSRITSSSRLSVSWRAPSGYTIDHYEIIVSETVLGTSATVTVPASETSRVITGLKAATTYSITVRACANAACTQSGASSPTSGTTSEEYWQMQGTGNSVAGLTRIVSDGNARISATRFGPDATGGNASRLQLYYGPMPSLGSHQPALAVATTSEATDARVAASYLNFTSMAGTTGLISPTSAATLISEIATGQGVPLSNGRVRLFFEAIGGDGKRRISYLDSQDEYTGRDFNAGTSGVCVTTADYQSGGCVPTIALALESDPDGNSKIRSALQFKIGYPTLNDWRWNGEAGTFMVFTTEPFSGCSASSAVRGLHAYAAWTGSRWQVQYDAAGCPKFFANVQAMFPMHVGDGRYKMYFGEPSSDRGTSPFPILGPKKLIYADALTGGSSRVVDFEDWESTTAGRNVIFVWPNGEVLSDTAEGFIDDFHFLSPTGSLDLQVMYMAITDGVIAPIGAAAVLLNP